MFFFPKNMVAQKKKFFCLSSSSFFIFFLVKEEITLKLNHHLHPPPPILLFILIIISQSHSLKTFDTHKLARPPSIFLCFLRPDLSSSIIATQHHRLSRRCFPHFSLTPPSSSGASLVSHYQTPPSSLSLI